MLLSTLGTLIALSQSFLNWRASCLVAICTSLNKRDVKVEAHRVDVISGLVIVQGIDYKVELTEKGIAKAIFLYPSNVVVDLDCGILSTDRLFECATFRHINMMSSEQKLSV